MKYLILLILSINTALACQSLIPESYVPTFLAPPVSGHYVKCESGPCHCVDNVDPYTSELVDNIVVDYVAKSQETLCVKGTKPEPICAAPVCEEPIGEEPPVCAEPVCTDAPFNEYQDCDDKFAALICTVGTSVKNYESLSVYCVNDVMKISGKKLQESTVKKTAYLNAIATKKAADLASIDNKKALKAAIKVEILTATTVAKLKAVLEKLIEVQE